MVLRHPLLAARVGEVRQRPHLSCQSEGGVYTSLVVTETGPYYEYNGWGYAVLPGVDIRCISLRFPVKRAISSPHKEVLPKLGLAWSDS